MVEWSKARAVALPKRVFHAAVAMICRTESPAMHVPDSSISEKVVSVGRVAHRSSGAGSWRSNYDVKKSFNNRRKIRVQRMVDLRHNSEMTIRGAGADSRAHPVAALETRHKMAHVRADHLLVEPAAVDAAQRELDRW